MLLEYYGLNEQPFGVTPDPRFMYFSRTHQEALASLVYGTESNRGFIALIARPGTGKTSLLYQHLEGVRNTARTAFLFQTDCHRRELLRHILADLGYDATWKDLPTMHEMFNKLLVQEMHAGRRVILVIDEAQNLEEKALESIRLLSNFETPWMKLVQIILAGQPQLAQRLAEPSLAQLRQRISMILRIEPLTNDEVTEYIRHRLWVAGYQGTPPFTIGAQALIASHSEGIPRNINNICFNAMSLACALKQKTVNREIVNEVLADLNLASLKGALPGLKAEEVPRRSTPTIHPDLKKERSLRRWLPKLAVASALLFAVSLPSNHMSSTEQASRVSPASSRKGVPLTEPSARQFAVNLAEDHLEVSSSLASRKAGLDANLHDFAAPPLKKPGPTGRSGGQGVRAVAVNPGQTLYRIIVANYGTYNAEILSQLRTLNPWLTDPNRVQSGQLLIMPAAGGFSGHKSSVVAQDLDAAALEKQ
jgi:general secretion pathway protein A